MRPPKESLKDLSSLYRDGSEKFEAEMGKKVLQDYSWLDGSKTECAVNKSLTLGYLYEYDLCCRLVMEKEYIDRVTVKRIIQLCTNRKNPSILFKEP